MGPLQGCRVIEFAGIGPGPFCGMLLADGANTLMAAFHLTANDTSTPAPEPGSDTESLMRDLGYTQQEIVELEESGTVKRQDIEETINGRRVHS